MIQDEKITVRMCGGLLDKLTHDARRQERSASFVVRRIVEQYYAKKTTRMKHLTQRKGD